MHDEDFDHEHEVCLTDDEHWAIGQSIREQDSLDLLTVGIDIGSSTAHLVFARVTLHRQKHDLSSRFVVVDRQTLWQSPIILTPFLLDGTIDAHQLSHFVDDAYQSAGISRTDVDSGAVILTGEAIKKSNAQAIGQIFAGESGKFVCATAGHHLESILAAHGSGAIALSARRDSAALHVDIGGGTTKLALVDQGEIIDVAAFAVGGRLLAVSAGGLWDRVDDSAVLVANELGIETDAVSLANPDVRRRISRRLAQLAVDQITGAKIDKLGRRLALTKPLRRTVEPQYVTFSGGVAEYLFGHETQDYGDIARDLASDIIEQLRERLAVPAVDSVERIRATVIGASQFTVQVSGKTIHMSAGMKLPVHNVPVVHLDLRVSEQLEPKLVAASLINAAAHQGHNLRESLAVAFNWSGMPTFDRLHAMAKGIADALGETAEPVAVVNDGDVGQTLGRLLELELGVTRPLISIDGIALRPLDFIDVGQLIDPPGVVPVVIKSLLFG
jgi:ethanolamine utilization protein EutA (predicted chaperonin)